MAQTKLDLSDNKFEQLSNEILHLSGCTHVFGQFQLESGSTLSILPNHDTGKVLTSNSGGTATWQVIPTIIIPITGATNGLSVTDKKIKLGGQLTGNTTIDILTSDLNLCSSTNINRGISLNQTGNELKLSWGDASSACTASISVNDLNVSLSSVYSGGGCAAGLEITHVDNRICLSSTGSNKTYHDNRGFHYVCDYSGGADSRWLPDKGYVDSKLSGNTSASGERITKLICQTSHGFIVKDVIGWSGGTYNKAIANGLYDGEVIGIVSKCYNANCFDLTQSGYITGLTGLTTSTTYFLSDVTAGLLTSIEPTGNTHISKSVLIANSSTSGWVLPYAGYVITTGASAGGTWGSITGILSDQCDLQTCLNGKLASGGTALCATTAGNALKLNNQTASFYLNTGSTAICATCAGNASTLVGCTPSCFLGVNATAVCATCAIGAKNLCGCVPASFLLSGGTAVNSSKLGGQLPAYYLNTGSTALCSTSSIDSKGLCGCVPTCFLGVSATAVCATCAIGSKNLCGCVPASFLLSGGTAVCATCAGNSSTLVGCTPSCFLGTTACACDSKCLGGHLPAYYINTGTTITCAADSAKLNNKLPAYYLNTGSTALCATCAGNASTLVGCTPSCFLGATATAVCATCAIGAKNLCGCVPASFLLSGGTAVCSTCAGNASTVAGCTPSCFLGATACACDSKCLGTHLPAYYLTSGGTAVCATCAISSKALCGCVPASFLLSGGTAVCSTTAGNSLKLGNQLPAYYLNTGSTITATNALCLGGVLAAGYLLSGGTAKNSLCLNGHTEAALSVCNAVCVNGHAEANLSVANSACLGGNLANTYLSTTGCACDSKCFNAKLPAYYLNTGSTALCASTAGNSLKLGNVLPAGYLLSGGTAVCATNAINSNNSACINGHTESNLSVNNSACLNTKLPAYYLNTGSTIALATCATTAGNALCLNGHTEAALSVCNSVCVNGHAEANLSVANSACVGGHLPAYFLTSGGTAVCATTAGNALCLGGVLPAGYLLSGGTAKNSTCLNGHLEAALSVCNSVCVNGHAEAALSVANSACLGGKVPAYYLNTGTTITATNTACLGGLLAACYALIASPVFTGVLCSAGQVINDLTGNGSNAYTIYKVTGTSINMTGSKYNFTGCACDRLDSGTYIYCCHSYNIWTNGISRVTVCGNGYVGIGTTAPEALLHICGVLNPAVGSIAKLDFGGSWNRRILFGICSSNNPHIQSINSAENAYTNLLINPLGGNVGIGTATPLTTLDVNGTLKLRSNNDGAIDSLQFANLTGGTKSSFYLISGDLRYYAGGDKVTFKADGAVGIGTATPTFKFELNGPSAYMHFVNAGTGCLATDGTIIGLDGASDLTFYIRQRENSPMLFYTNDTVRMCIMNSGEVCALVCGIGPDWIATSDCRLKKDIIPISNALSTVVKLQGVCYHLCSDEKCENNIGLIAQDVQKILPEIVSYGQASEEDFKYGICDNKLGLKYDKLSALFIEAFKEQQKQIEENEKQIRALCLELNYMRNYNK